MYDAPKRDAIRISSRDASVRKRRSHREKHRGKQLWPFDPHLNQIWEYLSSRKRARRLQEREGSRSNRKVRNRGEITPIPRRELFDLRVRSSTRCCSCSWLWSSQGSLETRLCSRSNHRIYVAWSVKGSTAAWDARTPSTHSRAHIHTWTRCGMPLSRSRCLHLAATPPWYQRSSTPGR